MLIHDLEALTINDLVGAKALRKDISGDRQRFDTSCVEVWQIRSVGIFDQGFTVAYVEKTAGHWFKYRCL